MGRQLTGITHPVIIRKLVPAIIIDKFIYHFLNRDQVQVTWLYGYPNRSAERVVSLACLLYNTTHFRPDWKYPQYCSQIDLVRFSSLSKPWLCEKHLRIFPPNPKNGYELSKLTAEITGDAYLRVKSKLSIIPELYLNAERHSVIPDSEFISPGSLPIIEVLVVDSEIWNHEFKWLQEGMLETWMFAEKNHNVEGTITKSINRMFILLKLSDSNLKQTVIMTLVCPQVGVYVVCLLSLRTILFYGILQLTNLLKATDCKCFPDMHFITADAPSESFVFRPGFFCKQFLSRGSSGIHEMASGLRDHFEIFTQIHGHVWSIILGN